MSDESAPNLDYFEEIAAKAATMLPELLKILEESISNGGRKTVKLTCKACSTVQHETIKVHDLKDTRDMVALLNSSQKIAAEIKSKRVEDDASRRAQSGLRAITEMSSEEIAAELARIDKELAA